MRSQEEAGEELDSVQGGSTFDFGTNPTKLDDDYRQPDELNMATLRPSQSKMVHDRQTANK